MPFLLTAKLLQIMNKLYNAIGSCTLATSMLFGYRSNDLDIKIIADLLNSGSRQEQVMELADRKLELDVLVLVDDSFREWIGSLEDKGDYLSKVQSVAAGKNEWRVDVSATNRDEALIKIIHDQIATASQIYENNPGLTKRLGRGLSFKVHNISNWNFDRRENKEALIKEYDAGGILEEMKKEFANYKADLVLAFTGMQLFYNFEVSQAALVSEYCAGLSILGQKYAVVGPDIFLTSAKKGSIVAHEFGHNLSLEDVVSKPGESYLMSSNSGKSVEFHPKDIEVIARHVKGIYASKYLR